MSAAELQQVMDTYDTNGDGQIDYSEMQVQNVTIFPCVSECHVLQDMMASFFGTGTSARRRE